MTLFEALTLACLSLAASPVSAHDVWIDVSGQGAQLRHGEPEVQLVEHSPGKLDDIDVIGAELLNRGQRRTVPSRKTGDGFSLEGAAPADHLVVQAQGRAVRMSSHAPGGALALYQARWGAWPLRHVEPAAMALDIVPVKDEPDTFTVSLNGAPLTTGTVKVIAPSLWIQIHDIDERGRVRINTPWQGGYVLAVEHSEQRSGEYAGQRYDTVARHATFSFQKPKGMKFPSSTPAQYRAH